MLQEDALFLLGLKITRPAPKQHLHLPAAIAVQRVTARAASAPNN
jgi:hypothetical protein